MRTENLVNHLFQQGKKKNHRADLEKFIFHWKYFLVSVFTVVTIAIIFLRYTPNQYEVNSTILIDDKENGSLASELSAFQDLGILREQKTTLETEITVLKSRTLIQNVIKNLGYNITYFDKGKVYDRELYVEKAPYKVNFLRKDSKFYQIDTSFSIIAKSKTTFELINSLGETLQESDFGDILSLDIGEIIITPSNLNTVLIGEEMMFRISPLKKVANNYLKRIDIAEASKKSNALVLSLKDPIKKKAIDIINELVNEYNANVIQDKSLIAKSTTDFINSRIETITKELEMIDKGVEEYKTDNNLTDINFEAGLILESNSEIEKVIVDLNSQIKLIDYVIDYMTVHESDLIPENLGLSDEVTSQSTLKYNQLLLERNRILKGSSSMNPTVINLESQIKNLRESIESSLLNLRKSLIFSLEEARAQEGRLRNRRLLAPRQEREFLDIKRRQQIIESLYLYLLQKREENAIKIAVPEPNAKVIDLADGPSKPVSPIRILVLIGGVLIGMVIPIVIIIINDFLDNKVHSIEDVESELECPILGEIPKSTAKNKFVIAESDSSDIAEAFRILRTNLNFMLSRDNDFGKSIFITSTISGEGKTALASNLAISLHLMNKKVLLIGGDIRKPKLNNYFKINSNYGLSEYLSDTSIEVSNIVQQSRYKNLELIHSGAIPPNPSELLTNGRFEKLILSARKNYDYLIVDTAPVHVVTDTLQLAHNADIFIYVVRANFLDKRLLKFPRMMYENKRLPNMGIVVNAVNLKKKNYGYGYGYLKGEKKNKWW